MPIIINEFEVISPQDAQSDGGEQPRGRQADARAGTQPPSESLRPEDVEHIMRRFHLRRIRLWAD